MSQVMKGIRPPLRKMEEKMPEHLINTTDRHVFEMANLCLISGGIRSVLYYLRESRAWINLIRSRRCLYSAFSHFLDIRKKMHILVFIALAMSGCGSGSDAGKVFVPGPGHPQQWVNPLYVGAVSFHGTAVKAELSGPAGGVLFLRHCAACHGETGGGKIGPKIQGVTLPIIDGAIRIVPLMKGHSVLSESEREEIAGYLAIVGTSTDRAVSVIDTGLCNECHGADLRGGIALVSCYSCHNGPDGGLGHPQGWATSGDAPVIFHGRYGSAFVSACANCHGVTLNGGIGPRCSSCHDGSTAPLLPPFSL